MVALRRQALGDGALDFLLLLRNERERAQPSEAHLAAYTTKKQGVLSGAGREAGELAGSAVQHRPRRDRHRALYLDFRFADDDWRTPHPRIARWQTISARGLRCAPRSRSMTVESFSAAQQPISGHSRASENPVLSLADWVPAFAGTTGGACRIRVIDLMSAAARNRS